MLTKSFTFESNIAINQCFKLIFKFLEMFDLHVLHIYLSSK